jgi:hypothetical protein
MLHITPENVEHAKERIQALRDIAYDYFMKHNEKTNRVSQRWNNEITDNQAIRYIHKMYWYRYFHLQQGKNISEDVMETIAEYYHSHNVKAYFNEKQKPKISSTDYYLMNSSINWSASIEHYQCLVHSFMPLLLLRLWYIRLIEG